MNPLEAASTMPLTPSGRKKPGKRAPYGAVEVVQFVSDTRPTPDVVFFTLPMLPMSVNHAFSNSKHGGRHKSKAYGVWRSAVDAHLAKHASQCLGTPYRATFTCPVSAQIIVRKPDNRRRDLDNFLKSLGDMFKRNHILKDDSQIVDLRIRWNTLTDAFYGEVHVEIRKV